MAVKDLHEMYKRDPDKFAAAAPPPPHQPVMTSWSSAFDLEESISEGQEVAKEVYWIAKATAFAVIAMQNPVPDGAPCYYGGGPTPVEVEKHAKKVLAEHGVTLADPGYAIAKYNNAEMEKFLCGLQRTEAVDIALHIYQKLWYHGVKKAVKKKDYFPYVLSRFKQARAAHEEAMKLVKLAFGRAVINPLWRPRLHTESILATVDKEEEGSDDWVGY